LSDTLEVQFLDMAASSVLTTFRLYDQRHLLSRRLPKRLRRWMGYSLRKAHSTTVTTLRMIVRTEVIAPLPGLRSKMRKMYAQRMS